MLTVNELEDFLRITYRFDEIEDYCTNGLVVAGKTDIGKIGFGVSFNRSFLDKAVKAGCDAVIVHHAVFQKGFFSLKGIDRNRIGTLLEKDISLFGMHLPMDSHPEIGHNALLMKAAGAEITSPLKWGFFGRNAGMRSLEGMLEDFHRLPHPADHRPVLPERESFSDRADGFNIVMSHGFTVLANGPEVPETIFIASGGSTDLYEEAVRQGADTFICGEIKEHIPSFSLETRTNFIHLGHYYSENRVS